MQGEVHQNSAAADAAGATIAAARDIDGTTTREVTMHDPLDGSGLIAWTFLGIIGALLVAAFFIGRWTAPGC